ncbi:M23 family metallopeptidase [Lederbergia citrea]|uniref:M23 family metallopeptidase n=1 Tax=Lederbergia citrea TaxID=2833581 RepID=UPI001BC9858B|nr:M23 family metallopeptidase [Lederbergia citrea]MBS4178550.1 M23 family metallopeptidase [Lederbergia citrea]
MNKILLAVILLFIFPWSNKVDAQELSQKGIYEKRMDLYKKTEAKTDIPWYYLAGIDQFERSIRLVRKDLPKPDRIGGYYIPIEKWVGPGNLNHDDDNPITISFFDGVGRDGNGDGKAERTKEEDLLFTLAQYISKYGVDENKFRIALWDYYKRDLTVNSIMTNVKLYKRFNRIDLDKKMFPIPRGYHYSYKNTWGARRGWGGRRIHEGTDIFAGYGVPVRSIVYGVVELKGWNKFGGWRVGIRDLNNTYHYYAHLNGFSKDLKIGDIVEPGTIIGSVGSSGYGPPGTSGKFPPHLHFGMYKDDGRSVWSFDPYPYLRLWERQERQKDSK